VKLVYSVSRYTSASRSNIRHIDNGKGRPLCGGTGKERSWVRADTEEYKNCNISICKKCLKKYDILQTDRIYVIQEHNATRLHYDLRLEFEGELLSFAIPKEPPTKEGVKRLVIRTRNHKLGYEKFEGTIPDGVYGAGTVKTWDRGTYQIIEKTPIQIIMQINGEKLKGRYILKKWLGRKKDWLFYKEEKE